jgi:hypothetical protein
VEHHGASKHRWIITRGVEERKMNDLKALWKETEEFVEQQEKEIAERYVRFLREVARYYISKGKRVFFSENKVVHYGEGGFGWMVVESEDDSYEVFGDYVQEIRFETSIEEKDVRGYIEIKEENLNDVNYSISG